MITDQLTNTIYFSHMLEQVCPDLYRSISTLKAKGYPIEFFQGAKDMWARDYMPIQVAPDKFVAFKYLPDYLLNPKYRDSRTENAADIAREILGDKAEVIDTDIIVDGGNVIKCDNAVIMVDKVIQANPHYSASKLLAELTRLFGCEVFLIPWDDEEGIYGHSDGVVRYLSDGDLLFTKYPSLSSAAKISSHAKIVNNPTRKLVYGYDLYMCGRPSCSLPRNATYRILKEIHV